MNDKAPGGYGVLGRHITENLATVSGIRLTIAGRSVNKGIAFAESWGIEFRQCDANKAVSLKNAVQDAWLVINASGQFKAADDRIPQCIGFLSLADFSEFLATYRIFVIDNCS